jgi:hypothetical protein
MDALIEPLLENPSDPFPKLNVEHGMLQRRGRI